MDSPVYPNESSKEIVESFLTSGFSPEETLKQLDSLGIEWFLTQQGDLMIKCWQVGTSDFVSPGEVTNLQGDESTLSEADALDWLSANLEDLMTNYAGQWIAIIEDKVVAYSRDLADLMKKIRESGVRNPLITQIPEGPIVWETAYGS
ncbi:MAG: DUF5678 domain-containing protein [Nitrospinota bacterium]